MPRFITKNKKKIPIRIGDTVKTTLGIGKVTFIRNDFETQEPRQFKVRIDEESPAKFHNRVQLIKRAKVN